MKTKQPCPKMSYTPIIVCSLDGKQKNFRFVYDVVGVLTGLDWPKPHFNKHEPLLAGRNGPRVLEDSGREEFDLIAISARNAALLVLNRYSRNPHLLKS